jgi:hypothetical protein
MSAMQKTPDWGERACIRHLRREPDRKELCSNVLQPLELSVMCGVVAVRLNPEFNRTRRCVAAVLMSRRWRRVG